MHRKFIAIGVDPGLSGAIAVLNQNGVLVDALQTPTVVVGSKNRVDGYGLAEYINSWAKLSATDGIGVRAFVELVHAMPGQGVTSMFTFGHSAGVVDGVLCASNIPIARVTPQQWKRAHGLISTDKDAARSHALSLWPSFQVLRAKGKGQAVADAALIALYGMTSGVVNG